MIHIETFAQKIAKKLSLSLHYSKERESILAYGLTAMMQFLVIFITTLVLGLLGGFWMESIIICLGVGYLRKSAGGIHANSMKACVIMSCLSITLLGFISSHFNLFSQYTNWILLYSVCYLICFFIMYKKAPLDSKNKRITCTEKLTRLRRECFIKLLIYYGVSLLLAFYAVQNSSTPKIANAFFFACLWQCFTLTRPGIYIINTLDDCFFR